MASGLQRRSTMTTPIPLLAIAASTLLTSLALTPSARADESGSTSGTSAVPVEEPAAGEAAPDAEAPAGEGVAAAPPAGEPPAAVMSALEVPTLAAPTEAPAGAGAFAPAPLAPTRGSYTTPPATVDEEGPRHPALGFVGIIAMVVGGGALATGVGLAASDQDGVAPTAGVGATVLLTGIVMTAVGYSSESRQERDMRAESSHRPARAVDVSTWEAEQASRETRRDVGIGLTIPGLVLGAGGAALIAKGLGGSDGGSFGLQIIGEEVPGGMLVGVGTLLLVFGVPLWIANSGEEPRQPVHAELGVGLGSLELRGSF